jgi:hypothetical protein
MSRIPLLHNKFKSNSCLNLLLITLLLGLTISHGVVHFLVANSNSRYVIICICLCVLHILQYAIHTKVQNKGILKAKTVLFTYQIFHYLTIEIYFNVLLYKMYNITSRNNSIIYRPSLILYNICAHTMHCVRTSAD